MRKTGFKNLNIQVNGEAHSFNVDEALPLLYLLRNNLELNGPKYGCGLGQCGSCMVIIDGAARPSCMVPCGSLEKEKIITLEGLAVHGKLGPLQDAFYQAQAAQCGYCLNGMVMASKALLDKNKNPSDEAIMEALQPVICRCGTHSRMIKAVKKAIADYNNSNPNKA